MRVTGTVNNINNRTRSISAHSNNRSFFLVNFLSLVLQNNFQFIFIILFYFTRIIVFYTPRILNFIHQILFHHVQ